jgi:uncharacterized RDD family membrane protein YckC
VVKRLLLRRTHYWDPAGSYVARFAPIWRRAAAAAIDWTLCFVAFLLVSIPLGGLQALGDVSSEEGDLGGLPGRVVVVVTQVLTVAPAVAYFALLLPTSHTLGMRALDVRIVSTRTGRAPTYLPAILRSIAATVVAVSVYATYLVATAFEGPGKLDSASSYALHAARVGAALGGLSALTMIVTPSHRSILDRLFGTAVVDELEAVTPRMGPWGPLEAFDLSSREREEGAG